MYINRAWKIVSKLNKTQLCSPFSLVSSLDYLPRSPLYTGISQRCLCVTSDGSNLTSNENKSKLALLSDIREGDWTCPGCGVLSFAWRKQCFKCGTLKPNSLEKKGPSSLGKKSGRKNKKSEEYENLKELLVASEKSRDFSLAIDEAEKRLKSRTLLKSSVVATIIQTFSKAGDVDRALEVFDLIGKSKNIRKTPTAYHYSAAISACARGGRWERALELLESMQASRLPFNPVVITATMTACAKSSRHADALHVFQEAVDQRARLDTACYNAAITSCCYLKKYSKAYDIFESMQLNKVKRDTLTFGAMLTCCDKAGDYILAAELVKQACSKRGVKFNNQMCTSAMGAYTNGGQPLKSLELFDEFISSSHGLLDAPLYTAALKALAAASENSRGYGMRALTLLREMAKRHIKVSQFAVVQAIHALDGDEMYEAAQELYDTGKRNGVFTTAINLDDDRRLDLRECSKPMMRAIIRSLLSQIRKESPATIPDILIVLGDRNKASSSFVVDVLKTNIISDNPIRNNVINAGALIRVPGKDLTKWIRRCNAETGVDSGVQNEANQNTQEKQPEAQVKSSNKQPKKKNIFSSIYSAPVAAYSR